MLHRIRQKHHNIEMVRKISLDLLDVQMKRAFLRALGEEDFDQDYFPMKMHTEIQNIFRRICTHPAMITVENAGNPTISDFEEEYFTDAIVEEYRQRELL
jgi:hypothetical protein